MHSIVVRPESLIPEALKGYPRWMAQLLCARNVETKEQAEAFLHPSREQILPPSLLHDMRKATVLLRNAVQTRQSIVVYGDYDCDGVCASAILLETLSGMGGRVTSYIPSRHGEGYGLNVQAVEKLAKEHQLLVTVDCGITSVAEVALAKELGMTVIITDHHTIGETLPPADAIVSPLMGGYPFPGLCGAGVAWKVALSLHAEKAESLMDLAALATVADMVPLLGENRALVKLGLEKLGQTHRPGLIALMNLAGIEKTVSAQQVAFQLAPRMNACGRMDTARIALQMLLEKDAGRALALAQQADELNEQRKQLETEVIDDAREQVNHMDLQRDYALVVHGEHWNSGVVGLAAGKLAEEWGYPAVALALDGENYVGSARSASGVDIYEALKCCEDLFVRFGGHRQAAGMTLPVCHLEAFRQRLSQAVKDQLQGEAPRKQYICDGEMALSDVTVENVEKLSMLEPFGMGNPAPVFAARHVKALNLRAVGAEGKHLQCTFQQGETLCKGIYFGGGAWQGREGVFTLVFSPTLNTFRGEVTAQLQMKYMACQVDALQKDADREARYLAHGERKNGVQIPALCAEKLDALMQGSQGTLLVCHCAETAMEMHRRFPKAVFAWEKADDPRAYHTILLYATARKACAGFHHVVLCDGELLETEAWQQACPGAQVHHLPVSDAVRWLAKDMLMEKAALREVYKMLRRGCGRDIWAFCEAARITVPQGYFALETLEEAGLIAYTEQPFAVTLLPWNSGETHDPAQTPFFDMIRRLTEA